jgi:hypothetical protein
MTVIVASLSEGRSSDEIARGRWVRKSSELACSPSATRKQTSALGERCVADWCNLTPVCRGWAPTDRPNSRPGSRGAPELRVGRRGQGLGVRGTCDVENGQDLDWNARRPSTRNGRSRKRHPAFDGQVTLRDILRVSWRELAAASGSGVAGPVGRRRRRYGACRRCRRRHRLRRGAPLLERTRSRASRERATRTLLLRSGRPVPTRAAR